MCYLVYIGLQESEGVCCLLVVVEKGDWVDKCLWMVIVREIGVCYNFIVLVGMFEQVVEVLLDYYDLGVIMFFICGFDLLEDVIDYGCELILCMCELVV